MFQITGITHFEKVIKYIMFAYMLKCSIKNKPYLSLKMKIKPLNKLSLIIKKKN